MATVITSIGSKSTTGDPVNGALTMITGGTGSGTPWTGTVKFSTSPTANIGDQLYFENVYHPGQFGSGCEGGGTAAHDVNFGNGYFGTTAVTSAEADDAGIGAFEYAPPTGYYALCTKNIKAYGG